MRKRDFDLVLYGATGFTGRQAAAYLKANAPRDLRWAIAGRDHAKLAALRVDVPILLADATDPAKIDAMVAQTRVLATTAGPFKLYGDPLVGACVRLGVNYADISGETARIRDLIDRYHQEAKSAGVRVVNFCAVSSIPSDVAIYLLNKHLGGRLSEAKGFFELAGGSFNGGTIASISHAHDSGDAAREKDVFLLGPERARPARRIERDPTGIHYDKDINVWTTRSPMGVSDTRAVRRSAALNDLDIVYQEYSAFPAGYFSALSFNAGFSLFMAAMSVRSVRNFLQARIPPGAGPSEEKMDAGWFKLRVLGTSFSGSKAMATLGGQGDVGNRITVKCLCESALALALDEARLPDAYGVLTPTVAFGDVLPTRLRAAGMHMNVQAVPSSQAR